MRLSRQAIAEVVFIAVAPVAAFFALRICLTNQAGDVDPWFYTGYGQSFKALQQSFGWTYYILRFPVILPYLAVPKSWDPVVGYAIFRYAICLLSGVPLYLWARHYFGVACAVAGYLFLFCNPLFPRLLLWDLTPFVSVPMALAGMALWQLPFKRQVLGRSLAGFCFCASVNSHAFTGTAIAVFFFVEATYRLIKREWAQFILFDVVAPIAGALLCLAIGLGCYYLILGPFDPRVLITVTLNVIRVGDQFSLSHHSGTFAWIWQNTQIIVPPLLVGFIAIGFPRELLRGTVIARVWWFSFLYCAGYAVYQFIFGRFVLETFYYFFHLTLVVYLLFPAALYLLSRQLPRESRMLVLAATVAVLVACPLFYVYLTRAHPTSMQWGTGTKFLAIGGLIAGITAICFVRSAAKSIILASLYAMVLTASIQSATISAPAFGGILANPNEAKEVALYRAGVQMVHIFARYAKPSHRVMLWYSAKDQLAMSLASTALVYSVNRPYQGAGLPNVGDYEIARLRSPDLTYIFLLSEDRGSIEAGKEALLRRGYKVVDVDEQTIGGKNFKADIDVVKLVPDANLARAMVQARSLLLNNLTASEQRSPGLLLQTPLKSLSGTIRMPLDAGCIAGDGWVGIGLYVVRGNIEVSVQDRNGNGALATISAAASPNYQDIVLPINSFAAAGNLVFKNEDKTSAAEGILQAVRVAARSGVPTDCRATSAHTNAPVLPLSARQLSGSDRAR